jgi:hypothetical protein
MDVKLGLPHEEICNEDFWEKVMRRTEWTYLEVLTDSRRKLRNEHFMICEHGQALLSLLR